MVSQQPQGRSDTIVGTTPQGGASRQGTGNTGSQQGGTAGQDVVQQTQEKAGQAVDQMKDQAGQVVDQAKQQATSQLDSRKNQAVDSLDTVAHALRQTSQHLRESNQAPIAQYADKAAERLEQFSTQMRGKDVQTMVRDVERYARQQPAIFLGGAFALGLLGARFLKSTAQREDDESGGDYRYDRAAMYNRGYGTRTPRYDNYRQNYSGSYRGQYDRGAATGRYGGQYAGGAATGGYGGTTSGYTGGATAGQYGGQTTGSATTGQTGTGGYGTDTGERSWTVRGTETR